MTEFEAKVGEILGPLIAKHIRIRRGFREEGQSVALGEAIPRQVGRAILAAIDRANQRCTANVDDTSPEDWALEILADEHETKVHL